MAVSRRIPQAAVAILVATLLAGAGSGVAQELEPRAYRALPVGFNFFMVTYSLSTGNVLIDPTAPVDDLDLDIHLAIVTYMRTFNLAGRSSSVAVNLPYGYITGSGTLFGEQVSGSRFGDADLKARLVVNILGGPAMTPQEFAGAERGRSFGASLTVQAPTGRYDPSLVVNFGNNRWGFKPEIGYSSVRGKWILDTALGVWFFSDNPEFFGGFVRKQDPIGAFQIHLSYDITKKIWISVDGNYFTGGRTTLDDRASDDLQTNSRIGLTLSLPVASRQSVRLSAATGAYTSYGSDFEQLTVSYLYRW